LGDTQRRLDELREREARLKELEGADEVGLKLKAMREDIRAAQADLDAAIAASKERAKRLEGPPKAKD
jgi:hypothetical protein